MKNLNYFPYERNRYFYGKLLSVDDFESEQKYMNDKRRLINRFLHGCGVVCGLRVIPVGDDMVSIEAGVALDFAGREIVLEKPMLRHLSDIEGFSKNLKDSSHESCQYLCIEYMEYEKDPVYGIAGGSSQGEQVCYNKIAEGCHIYLTNQEPESKNGNSVYYEEWKTVYWDKGIRISQVFPRYAKSGSEFEFRIVVENMGQKLPISFGYELELDCLEKERDKKIKILFEEKQQEKKIRYEIPIMVRAADVKGVKASAVIQEGSFWLKVGDHEAETKVRAESTVEITEENAKNVMESHYYENAMHEIINDTYHQSIYLAKVCMVWAGDAVVIEDVEQMPFQQYLCSDILSSIREKAKEEEFEYLKRQLLKLISEEKRRETKGKAVFRDDRRISGGIATIELGIGGRTGQRFFSSPIVHGLGLGKTIICCSLPYKEKDHQICYGARGVFEEADGIQGDVAARADITEGTFVIGIRLSEPTTEERVKIHWMAFQDEREQMEERDKQELFLKPDMVYLSPREDYFFEAVFTGVADQRVQWSVCEERGGVIDENGMYTAPNVPGIYEINGKSAAYPELIATAFVVVRDSSHH